MVKIYKSKGGSICNLFTDFTIKKTKQIRFNNIQQFKEYNIYLKPELKKQTSTHNSRLQFHTKQKLKKAIIEIEIIKPIEIIRLIPEWTNLIDNYIKKKEIYSYNNLNINNKIKFEKFRDNAKIFYKKTKMASNTYHKTNNNNKNNKIFENKRLLNIIKNDNNLEFKDFLIRFILNNLNEENIQIKINNNFIDVNRLELLYKSATLNTQERSEIFFIIEMLQNYSNISYTYNDNLFTIFNLDKNQLHKYMHSETMIYVIRIINKYKLYKLYK